MATQRKPSHPSNHTAEMLEKALRDRDRYNAERAGKKPSKVLALRDESVLVELQRERWDHIPAPSLKEKISSAIQHISEKVEKVAEGRRRSRAANKPMPRPSLQIEGQETIERAAQAKDGVDGEALSTNEGHRRARIRLPMALSEEKRHREHSTELAVRMKRKELVEPPIRGSRFDLALDGNDQDGPILRAVLSRYIVDHVLAMRGEGGGVENARVQSSSPHDRLPLTEDQRRALHRLNFVHKNVSRRDKADLEKFKNMMIPDQPNMPVLSMAEFTTSKTNVKDHVFREGFFSGIMWKLAERLHDVYRLETLPAHLAEILSSRD